MIRKKKIHSVQCTDLADLRMTKNPPKDMQTILEAIESDLYKEEVPFQIPLGLLDTATPAVPISAEEKKKEEGNMNADDPSVVTTSSVPV